MERPEKEILRHLYDSGLSGRGIAQLLNAPYPTVFSWMKQLGIPLRSRSQAVRLYLHQNPGALRNFIRAARVSRLGKPQTEEEKEKRAAKHRGQYRSEETKRRISAALKGRVWSAKQRERCLPIIMANRRRRPTRLEVCFQEIISRHELPYKYVGDGHTFIAGRCPDFLNVDGQKTVVEIFGRWWHDPSKNPRVKPQHTESATLAHYATYGFKCIIIWEEELADEATVVTKLRAEEAKEGLCCRVAQP